MAPYDAFLLVSFGGPEGPGDVMPFLQNVTAGRDIPAERLEAVAEHYYLFGGVSPINQQCRDLIAAVEKDFAGRGVTCRCTGATATGSPTWPTRWPRWRPTGSPRAGVRDLRLQLVLQLPAVPRRHRGGPAAVGAGAPQVDKIRQYFNHPGFIGSFAAAAATQAMRRCPTGPAMTRADLHRAQHPEAMAEVGRARGRRVPGSAGRGGAAGRGRDRLPAAVAPGLLKPERTAVSAVARA